MKIHPITACYPMCSEEELAELVADIRARGLLYPATVQGDTLLDGRNRMKACELAGVPLRTVEYDGDDPAGFIISTNTRRNLSVEQKALVAARIANLSKGRPAQNRQEINPPTGGFTRQPEVESHPVTQAEAAKALGVSVRSVQRAKVVLDAAPELAEKVAQGKVTLSQAEASIKREKRAEARKEELKRAVDTAPVVECADALEWLARQEPADLLLTDPPYMTDVPDIDAFARSWLPLALSKVKRTGRAYIFVGAYPEELHAYKSVAMPTQVLVWTYRNVIGVAPKQRYRQNWQAILYYEMPDAPPLDCESLIEQFSVHDVNAPDGRLGDRYHTWQKPMALAERFIRHSTKPGDVVIDPFVCTGTFVLAAAKLGRIGRGCDINAEFLAIAEGLGCRRV